ncbi:hypothetical protein C8J56DRAFT_901383 [Mycena floridula]|nr:hypothetical protein C8J56DRAFT_901383 [Mycena floridula]
MLQRYPTSLLKIGENQEVPPFRNMSDRLDQGPQEISSSAASAPLQTQWSAQDIKDTAGAASPVLLANPTDAWIWKHRHLYLQSLQKGTYQQFIAEMVPVYKKEVSMPEDKDSSMTLPSWPWPWPSSATRKRISLALDVPEAYTLSNILDLLLYVRNVPMGSNCRRVTNIYRSETKLMIKFGTRNTIEIQGDCAPLSHLSNR